MPQDHAAPVLSLVRAQVVLVANLGDLFFVLLTRARQECVGHTVCHFPSSECFFNVGVCA